MNADYRKYGCIEKCFVLVYDGDELKGDFRYNRQVSTFGAFVAYYTQTPWDISKHYRCVLSEILWTKDLKKKQPDIDYNAMEALW